MAKLATIRRPVAREQIRGGAPAGFVLAVDIGERLTVGGAHDETRISERASKINDLDGFS